MFAKNLKFYRLKRGLTARQLAEKCGVTPMAISNYEQDKRLPSMDIIKRLANALDVQVINFMEYRNENLEFKHGSFGANSGVNVSTQDFVFEAVEEYCNRFFNIVDILGSKAIPAAFKVPRCKSSGDHENDATKMRSRLGFSESGPVHNLTRALENRGFVIIGMDIADDKFTGIYGYVGDYPYIAYNRNMSYFDIRMTIACELFWLMFGDSCEFEKRAKKYIDDVARAFLLPLEDIIRELGIKRMRLAVDMVYVCEDYGISIEDLLLRARQLNIVSDKVARSARRRYVDVDDDTFDENTIASAENPSMFSQLVYRAIAEDDINIQKGAELLGESYEYMVVELNKYGTGENGTR